MAVCNSFLLLLGDVYMVHDDLKGYLWGIMCCIAGEDIYYQHLLTRVVLDGDIIGLQVEHHSLEADSCIFQVFQLGLLKRLVLIPDSDCMARNMSGTVLHQRHMQAFHILCLYSAWNRVAWRPSHEELPRLWWAYRYQSTLW